MQQIYLERIDPTSNARRFYFAFIAPTVLAPICVIRIHGRIGGWRRVLPPLVFAEEAGASRWLARQQQRKLRRGYGEGS